MSGDEWRVDEVCFFVKLARFIWLCLVQSSSYSGSLTRH